MTIDASAVPDWLASALRKPVAIFGSGASGQAAESLLAALGAELERFDERSEEPSRRRFEAQAAGRFGLAICSPGFPSDHPWLQAARSAGVELVPEPDLGASLWKGPIVAITGTNGKTTLTEFLSSAFNGAGIEAFACGNIGRPLSRLVADGCNREAVAVCEVSSFQAEFAKRLRADHVLWTNFDEDHLDRHGSMAGYFGCKYRLVELMRGRDVFFDASVWASAATFGKSLPASGLIAEPPPAAELGVAGTLFESLPERNTYAMARALWLRMGLSEEELIEAAHNFAKSPHRMELITSRGGVSYWDDSKATNFHAVFGALRRFERPVVWIGGGKNKGGDLGRFAARLAKFTQSAHLIGETAPALAEVLAEHGAKAQVYRSLEEAVAGARAASQPGDNILLSPGFASLDMFEGYSQRGEAFRKAINSLEDL